MKCLKAPLCSPSHPWLVSGWLMGLCCGAARWGGLGVSPGSGTQSCFTHCSVKNITLLGLGLCLIPCFFPFHFHTAVKETVCWSQTNADRPRAAAAGGPGAGSGHTGQCGTFGVNMWHVGVPKAWLVASICLSKSLSGSFTHVTACMCLKREGKHIVCPVPSEPCSFTALGPEGCWSCKQENASSWITLSSRSGSKGQQEGLSEIFKPPSSASLRNTTFKQCECQDLPFHTHPGSS